MNTHVLITHTTTTMNNSLNERLDTIVPTDNDGSERSLDFKEASRHDSISLKRPMRKRSFTCSARDFVPRRTDRFEDNYDLGSLLGEGAFGEVYECVNIHNGADRAVKIIHKDRMCESDYEEVINEFQILKQIDNPNVIRMYEFYDTQDTFYIVQELAKGGELYDELEVQGNLSEKDTALLIKQVLSCLKYLHSQNVIHRDINLENILLESNKDYEQLKIIDFGLATTFEDGVKLTEVAGKIHYLAPEVLEEGYGPKYDVWSVGVIAYILLSGFAPFEAEQDSHIRELIVEGKLSFDDPEWQSVSQQAKDFVAHLLTHDEADRPTAEQALRHPYIVGAIQESTQGFCKRHSLVVGQALSNMRSFSNNSKLKQAACSFIASQLLQKEEREQIDRIFRGMDDDCDGRLSVDDLQAKYREFNDSELSRSELADLFENCDMTGSGYIDYSEFVIASMRSTDLLNEKKLQGCFDSFDTERTGFISAVTLNESLANLRDGDEDEGWDYDGIIEQVDDGLGLISYEEFKDIMNHDEHTESTDAESDFEEEEAH
jgi:calcium-dependent protein kinase